MERRAVQVGVRIVGLIEIQRMPRLAGYMLVCRFFNLFGMKIERHQM